MSVPAQTHLTPPEAVRIDFGWITQAWALFWAQAGVWVGAMLLCFFLDAAAWVLLSVPTGVFASTKASFTVLTAHPRAPLAPAAHPYQQFAQGRAFGILAAWPIAVFNGGFFRMALRQKRGEAISVSHLFSGFPHALPLLAVATVIPALLGLTEGVSLWLLHFSMTPTAAIAILNKVTQLPGLLLPSLFMFAPLLVVDAGAAVPDALLGSIRLLQGRWLLGIAFYVVITLLTYMGHFFVGLDCWRPARFSF